MTFFLQIAQMVLPVLVAILLGCLCRRNQLFGTEGLAALKSIIGGFTLPVVLFKAFFTADYSSRVLLIFVVIFACCSIAFAAGFALRGLVGTHHTFFPFLLTSFEAGMLGYALFGLLVGNDRLSTFAMVDIGQTLFAYTVFLAGLKLAGGEKISASAILHNMVTNRACMGMLLGVLLGVTGVGGLVLASPAGGLVLGLMNFIEAPTAFLILVIVGYELSLKKELLRPVFITVLTRLLIMAGLLCLAALIIFRFIPFDKTLLLALMVLFSLPAPFIIPLFADVKQDAAYISTTYSVSTLLTVVLFVGISVYHTL